MPQDMSYEVASDGSWIKCLECEKTSHHPEDVKNRYCGHCNKYHDVLSYADEVLSYAEDLAERREMLCKKPPLCPDCGTDQVQLTEWIKDKVAEWKCRHCRVRFKFERDNKRKEE